MALYKGLIPGVKIRGGDDDDEKQRGFDDLTGHQTYSSELANGFSGTLDWLAPAAMPFFMGVELAKLTEDGGLELKDLERSLAFIAEPMLQMSMLQGVNDTLDNLKYSSDNLGQLAATLALSYLTQGFTNSMVGQIERAFESERRSTYIDPQSPVPKWREIGKAFAKTPGLDYHRQPYVNTWGETESSGTIPDRILNNFLNPGFVSHVENGELERELQRLADATDSSGVFPGRVDKSLLFGLVHRTLLGALIINGCIINVNIFKTGVSRLARRDPGLCPGPPAAFEKAGETFICASRSFYAAAPR